MRQTALALGLVLIGYVLGSLQGPAKADDSEKMLALMRDLVRAEEREVDALRNLADRVDRLRSR